VAAPRRGGCTITAAQYIQPPPGHVEVPRCPVCLERLDPQASGILTVLCNHSFHSDCLTSWGDSNSCPVCRYCRSVPDEPLSGCPDCVEGGAPPEALWMCLICGNIGCGRYDAQHSVHHQTQTGHNYAIELSSQRVWDYAGDCYVHRLISNKLDGKLVELDDPLRDEQADKLASAVGDSKRDGLAEEYEMLLTTTLEQQRLYYAEQLREFQNTNGQLLREQRSATKLREKAELELQALRREHGVVEQLNAAMRQNARELKTTNLQLRQEVAELTETNRDLLLHVQSAAAIVEAAPAGGGDGLAASEASGGSVELRPSAASLRRGGKKKKR
jgi:BRCA1-associated protein